jgi:hypothetical protein
LLVIHPGFAKTATTSLQQGAFARHGQVHYLGVPAPDPALDALLRRVPREISHIHDLFSAAAPSDERDLRLGGSSASTRRPDLDGSGPRYRLRRTCSAPRVAQPRE